MPLAIQEDMLLGTTLQKFEHARKLGLAGIEVWADDFLEDRVPEIIAASQLTGIQVSAVNAGNTRLIHPEYDIRDQALVAIRKAMSIAVDLGAQGVVFKPFYAPHPVLPDLHPYKSSVELEAELLVTQLRATLCDLAYALGTELLMQPASYKETHLLRCVEHGAVIRRKLDDHPHLKLAANLYHMSVEGEEVESTFSQYTNDLDYVYLSDTDHMLPGRGQLDFGRVAAALQNSGYKGWLTLECGEPGHNMSSAHEIIEQLPACMELLRETKLL